MSDINKFTSKEVLNKVLLDSSGDAVNAFSHTTQEALNAALDATNNRLNVSLAGGTISGDVAISGDLTVTGNGGGTYDEIISGNVRIGTNVETANTNFDNLVIEGSSHTGISIFSGVDSSGSGGTDSDGGIYFGDNASNNRGQIKYSHSSNSMSFTTDDATALTLGSDQSATFSQTVDGDAYIALDNVAGAGSSVNETAALRLNLGDGSTVRGGAKITAKKEADYSTGANMDASLMFSVLQNNAFNDALFLTSAGRVGIGDSVPLSALHVQGDTSGAVQVFINNIDGSTDSSSDLVFGNWSGSIPTGAGNPGPQAKISAINTNSGTAATDLVFSTYGSATNTEAMRIKSDSHVEVTTGALKIKTAGQELQWVNGATKLTGADSYLEFNVNSARRFKLDANSRISLSNNDSGGTGGADSTSANTVLGYLAGTIDSGSVRNTFIGHKSGFGTLSDALDNTCVGHGTGIELSQGDNNVLVGSYAGYNINTGSDNVNIGKSAGNAFNSSNTIAIGSLALGSINSADADGTIAIGRSALTALTSGGSNTAIGFESMLYQTDGANNTALGYKALRNADNGESLNTVIGTKACEFLNHASSDGNTVVGTQALVGGTGARAYNTVMGYRAMGSANTQNNIGGNENVFLGAYSGNGTWASAASDGNTAVGYQSMQGAMNGAENNVAVGKSSLLSVTTGVDNTILGTQAADALLTGNKNVAIGRLALSSSQDADNCIAIGYAAMNANNDANSDGSIAIGYAAMNNLSSGSGNVGVGHEVLKQVTTGGQNTAVGFYSLDAEVDGDKSTAVGYQALTAQTGINGTVGNTAVGYQAGQNITTGIENTIVGAFSTISAVGGQNQTAIGSGVTGQGNNSVTLGNASVTEVYMSQAYTATVFCGGIRFPASQSASGNANQLDDYEEGNFTVTIKSGDSGAISAEEGEYVKIGKMVHFRIVFDVSTNFSTQFIDGLPFSCTNAASPSGLIGAFGVMTSSSNDEPIFASVEAGTTTIRFSSGTDASDAHLPNTTNDVYRFSGFYFAS